MDDEQLLRYSRHILLPEIGVEGQEAVAAASVLIVGAGGLGSPAAMYLAAAGVGELRIADDDVVDLTNLQRQLLHATTAVGTLKVDSARSSLHRLNPLVKVVALAQRLDEAALRAQLAEVDVVLDCSDNFVTRHAINCACVATRTPLVSGAAIRFDGQLSVFDPREDGAACYHCLFPEGEEVEETRCAVMGVFAPVVGIIGACQAAEALKLLIGCGEPARGRLLLFDALRMSWRSVGYGRDPGCSVCGGG